MSLFNKAKEFAESASTWVLAGMPIVTDEIYEKRLDICESCNYFNEGKCKHCGCYMKAKCWLETETCPINKW